MPSRNVWTIGRGEHNDISIANSAVSNEHAKLTFDGERWHIEDLNSTNGTWVDGVKLTPRTLFPVALSNKIMLGSSVPLPWPQIPTTPMASVAPGLMRIGRAPDSDLQIDLPTISWNHAVLSHEGDRWKIEDAGSRNGIAIGSLANRVRSAVVQATDDIYFGTYKTSVQHLMRASGAVGDAAQELVDFAGKDLVIGRSPECDQVLDFPMISWRHAKLSRTDSGIFVEDLGSKNGTFVNGQRITERTKLGAGAQIGLGSFRFQLQENGALVRREYFGNITLEAAGLGVAIGNKRLLAPTSFTIYPSELVALMGPAGAGKTTLLKALNGYTRPAEGRVLFNGASLYQYYELYRLQMGYVPQDDIVHSQLQVDEALRYSLKLRTDLTDDEMEKRIVKVLKSLNIEEKKSTIIGSPEKKVLSGGQRKRVNIALELIHETPVLFLDEPTSGLSSYDAEGVIRLLKQLASEGKTVVTTIHQPSLTIYKEFDNLIMVGRDRTDNSAGSMVFFGPAYPDSIQFFRRGVSKEAADNETLNPDTLLSDLETSSTGVWEERYKSSTYYEQFVKQRAGTQPEDALGTAQEKARRPFDLRQWFALASRNLRCKIRDRAQSVILLLQAPTFAVLLTAMMRPLKLSSTHAPLGGDDLTKKLVIMHFLMVVASIWFGCNNAARDIVGEWSIYQRERMVSLKLPSYLFSKLAVLFVIGIVQNLIMLTTVYFGVDTLRGNFLTEFGVLLLANMIGAAIGLCLSARASSTESAIALLPVVLLPVIALGGGLQPTFRLPTPVQWVSAVVPSRWAFEANLGEESRHWPRSLEMKPKPQDPRTPIPKVVEEGVPNCPQELGAIQDAGSGVIPLRYVARNGDCPARPASNANDPVNAGLRLFTYRPTLENCLLVLTSMFVFFVIGTLVVLRLRDVQ